MKIEGKVTVWQSFEIPDSAKDALHAFLKENPKADFIEIFQWAEKRGFAPSYQTYQKTAYPLPPDENGGSPTVKIFPLLKSLDKTGRSWSNTAKERTKSEIRLCKCGCNSADELVDSLDSLQSFDEWK